MSGVEIFSWRLEVGKVNNSIHQINKLNILISLTLVPYSLFSYKLGWRINNNSTTVSAWWRHTSQNVKWIVKLAWLDRAPHVCMPHMVQIWVMFRHYFQDIECMAFRLYIIRFMLLIRPIKLTFIDFKPKKVLSLAIRSS